MLFKEKQSCEENLNETENELTKYKLELNNLETTNISSENEFIIFYY